MKILLSLNDIVLEELPYHSGYRATVVYSSPILGEPESATAFEPGEAIALLLEQRAKVARNMATNDSKSLVSPLWKKMEQVRDGE
jgi:hypothetical protein